MLKVIFILNLPRYWTYRFNPKYGNCFTFNSMENAERDPQTPRLASLTGRDYGKSKNKHNDNSLRNCL